LFSNFLKMKKSTKIFTVISRLLVGCVFIFSGFVKGIDPLGTAYRIEDYFIAFGTQWAIPSALYLSVFLCTVEFSVGILLLLNVRIKEVAWLLLLMMLFLRVQHSTMHSIILFPTVVALAMPLNSPTGKLS